MCNAHCVFIIAACSPACQNGGTCFGVSSSAYCVSPSGYSGAYCQDKGIMYACISLGHFTQPLHGQYTLCVYVQHFNLFFFI